MALKQKRWPYKINSMKSDTNYRCAFEAQTVCFNVVEINALFQKFIECFASGIIE